ncbi:hypothetical protein BSL78_27995 [Apostichopus japonicus]|uniref:BTB domain-containing protein n=1 Tax=Stichopus japonicus TaxID=307972 RepID=A0A2G8JHF8_STIJA|nr:hypothetical protein BSL78_27995 [Apostichopus japonicus]
MLAIMFNQQMMPPAEEDESGQYLIDRDGQLFRYVLNYLRNGELNLPEEFTEYKQLLAEARFYQINPLIEEIQTIFDKDASVILNVGGQRYVTSKSNLSKFKESLLCRMLTDEDGTIRRDDYGYFTIDRDGVLFRHILNYLRDGELNLPKDFPELKQLLAEARFYQIKPLIEEIQTIFDKDASVILNVGGQRYVTSKSNLSKFKESLLCRMLTEEDQTIRKRRSRLFHH